MKRNISIAIAAIAATSVLLFMNYILAVSDTSIASDFSKSYSIESGIILFLVTPYQFVLFALHLQGLHRAREHASNVTE
jgi:hypothetical protein